MTIDDVRLDVLVEEHVPVGEPRRRHASVSRPPFGGCLNRSPDERVSAGLNRAATNVDVVVGSPDVQIDGIHPDGSVVAVTRGDEFVLQA